MTQLLPVPVYSGHGHGGGHHDLVDWIVRGFGWRIGSDFAHHLPFAVIAVVAVVALLIGARSRFGSPVRRGVAARRRR